MNPTAPLAFLTGAAAGIGRALAQLLAQHGYRLWLVDRDEAGLHSLRASLPGNHDHFRIQVCDLANEQAVTELCRDVAQQTQLNLLINNAGVVHYGPTAAMTQEQLARLMRVNLLAPMQITQYLLPRLLTSDRPHIVNIASIYGIYARRFTAAYHASKFGLLGFSESLRKEYRGRLGVTTVCPGFVSTQLFASGTCSTTAGEVPHPPAWLCSTPATIAQRTWQGVCANRGLVVVGWHARTLYYGQRFCPWLLDWFSSRQTI